MELQEAIGKKKRRSQGITEVLKIHPHEYCTEMHPK